MSGPSLVRVRVLLETHPAVAEHNAGPGHPERPGRLDAVLGGIESLLDSLAVCAAVVADRGERVVVVDWDGHHGNGTQDAFFADPRVEVVEAAARLRSS